jgi:hypothetical protein
VFPLAQHVYVKGVRATAPGEGDMGEAPCMDIAYLGAVLVSRTRDVTSKVVSVDVVDVDAL